MELNPNHPVTQEVRSQWHKLCAIVMSKHGLDTVEIESADLDEWSTKYPNGAVVCDTRGGRLTLRLVDGKEANRLARQEGGLPV